MKENNKFCWLELVQDFDERFNYTWCLVINKNGG